MLVECRGGGGPTVCQCMMCVNLYIRLHMLNIDVPVAQIPFEVRGKSPSLSFSCTMKGQMVGYFLITTREGYC